MPDYRSRQELRSQIVEVFAAQEEVYKICVFGKVAAQKDDQYSDVDLFILSNDPLKTWQHYRQAFVSIAPVVGTFSLGGGQDWFAEMLLLDGFSPYQKVDFSIGFGLDLVLTTVKTVYHCPDKELPPVSSLPVTELRYDVVYYLADQLFSIPRFTKCLFRQDIDGYRRWTGSINRALVLMYEKKFGWAAESRKSKLLSFEMEKLTANLSGEERQAVFAVCPPDGQVNIARSFLNAVNLTVALSREKANDLGVTLNEDLIARMQGFMKDEIERYMAH